MGNINSLISINTIEVLALFGMAAAYFLGKQQATPKNKWPKGGILDGGYDAWRIPLVVMLAVAVVAVLFGRVITSVFSGFGGGGGYGPRYGPPGGGGGYE